ncbi:NADH dehydrogenase/oxidoreductase [Parvularcula bermudensis HTCC2503]|uniref:NADH dehydrogenase/oxidoreductase n=1 Tax=Parvularcula bermudensis (strain ATCC BAA-594 / HTCC2503 / KCTC 12087) TaxID=314260 RepID=E0TD60_PARBH|nr:monovalent cation/H+ antiporter subunit D family protein [Parvularcula bermudensis]ADM08719.1 NADH dehydrogenase/oxidoreductase [Parvularcula bermudensis HTCC2503]
MTLADHLAVLPVLLPLLAAPICVLLPRGNLPWAFATLIAWLSFWAAAALLVQVRSVDVVDYALGGWPAPLGIVYRIDVLGALVMALISGIAAAVLPFARQSLARETSAVQSSHIYGMILVSVAGLLGVVATGDAFNLFVFLEISSLSTYTLVAMGARQDRRALTAAFTYLVLGTIGATFFVIGIGLLYQATGTLNMIDLHERLSGQDDRVVRAGFAFVVTGLALKLAMFPMHRWLPDAYTFAPSVVTAILAATSTKAAIYALMRFLFTVFGFTFPFLETALFLLMAFGLAGMVIASLIAVFRDDVKQILAFSSVAQVGYMLLGISIATSDGVSASIVHVFNHALMKAALFMAVGAVFYAVGSHRIAAYRGLFKTMPFTACCFISAGLSLIGVPFTAGFVSKYVLIEAALAATLPVPSLLLVGFVVVSSLIAVAYVGRVAYAILLDPPPENQVKIRSSVPLGMLIPMGLMTFANLYVGFDAEGLIALADHAADILTREGLGR